MNRHDEELSREMMILGAVLGILKLGLILYML